MRKHFLRYIRDISIALSVVSGMAMCYRAYARRRGALVRVVVFHDVSDAMWFERLIAHMRARYHVLTPTDFFANTFHPKKINILITFDDGYASWATVCAPILDAEGVSALFFVNSHLLEVSHDSELTRAFTHDNLLLATPHALLTSKQLISLIGQGHSIGGHTKNHARLATLQKDEEEAEVVEDKKVLETYTHDALRAFAYPFGHRGDFTSRSVGAVARAGYTHAFTTESAFVPMRGNQYTIPRICIEDNLSLRHFDKWMYGGYDMFSFCRRLFCTDHINKIITE